MKNKKRFSEIKKCVKCESVNWTFLIKDDNDKVIRCNDCPEEITRAMKFLALRYLNIAEEE